MKAGPAERELGEAVRAEDLEGARRALQQGANPNAIVGGKNDLTPLGFAVMLGNGPLARLLLESGADANHSDADGVSLLSSALYARRWEIVGLLLAHGARPADLHLLLFPREQIPEITKLLRELATAPGRADLIAAIEEKLS
jgi:ankyrin repeat protein